MDGTDDFGGRRAGIGQQVGAIGLPEKNQA
jgi:hypothetical protein